MTSFLLDVLKAFLGAGVPLAALFAILGNFKINRMTTHTSRMLEDSRTAAAKQLEDSRQESARALEDMRQESARRIEDARQENARQLEVLRTELRAFAYRQEVQYSRLYEKRLALIGQVHALAFDAQGHLQSWMSPGQTAFPKEGEAPHQALERQQNEKRVRAAKAMNRLIRVAGRNCLYFPEPVGTRVQVLIKRMREAHFKYTEWDFIPPDQLSGDDRRRIIQSQREARDIVFRDLDTLLEELRADFKAILDEQLALSANDGTD